MILPCSKCARQYIFLDERVSEWHTAWVCDICEAHQFNLRQRVYPSVSDAVNAAVKDVMASLLGQILDVNNSVTKPFSPEKAAVYNAGFSAAIVAVSLAIGLDSLAPSHRDDQVR